MSRAVRMDWNSQAVEHLASTREWNYRRGGDSYAEPAALTALALIGAGQAQESVVAAEWLAQLQSPDGTVGVSARETTPCWPTALAISVWSICQEKLQDDRFTTNIESALNWTFEHQGKTAPRRDGIGHDTSLRGWSWALGTHAWLEPTSMFVTALHHAGKPLHPRTIEAVRMIVDRQLPRGGFNYGNTFVLGQQLLSHVQPTGIALSALAVANIDASRVERSLRYLQQRWADVESTASLCYASMGLAAYGRSPDALQEKLERRHAAWKSKRQGIYKLALLTLAAQNERCPLIHKRMTRDEPSNA